MHNPKAIANLTPKQLLVLQAVAEFQSSHCYSPTMEEIAELLNVKRPTVYEHIEALRRKQLLANSSGKARCLQLTGRAEEYLNSIENNRIEQFQKDFPPPQAAGLSLLGRVSAGYGIEAVEDKTEFGIAELFGQHGGLFVLEVCGQSMINAGICDRDYLVCKSAQTADNGQLVIALLDGRNATIKRFFRDKKGVCLQPENDCFDPIYPHDCTIQAIVVGLIRRM